MKHAPEAVITYLIVSILMLACSADLANAQRKRGHQHKERDVKSFPLRGSLEKLSFTFQHAMPFFPRKDTVEIVFIGDVMMHKRQLEYNHDSFLEGIRARLSDADLAVANMEFTLAGKPYSGYPAFSAPDSFAVYVADCGVDVFLTANNHILDKGKAGAERTIDIYSSMAERVKFTGLSADEGSEATSYPLIVPVHGIRVAFINFTYGTNSGIGKGWPKVNRMDREDVGRAFDRAHEAGAEYIVALPHWGEEYELRHSGEQEEWAEWMAEQGADIIIGSHPHVVQDSTSICTPDGRRTAVFYSLGNAVSNMSAPNTRLGLIVTVRIERDINGDTRMLEPKAEFLWCTLPDKLTDSFMTIAVADYDGRRELWKLPSDYDNMHVTLERVKKATGIR